MTHGQRTRLVAVGALALAASVSGAFAQVGYGVNANGQLFRFSLTAPNNPVVNIGNVGFVPEGIDFRPGSDTLYAIDIGTGNSQLYSININNGAASPIGAAFPSVGTVGGFSYNLANGTSFGFDVNPRTLQADNSIRIRLTSNTGQNLRLNSSTGQIANVDGALAFAAGDPNFGTAPSVDAVAYINSNAATMGGATTLYTLDFGVDDLSRQDPPNNGTQNTVGSMGVGVNALANMSFDILTDPGSVDDTIGGDAGWAVIKRPDAPIGGPFGVYLLYQVNLSTGAITNGAGVGILGGNPHADFTGGFATIIPAPGALALLALSPLLAARRRR